MKRILSVMCLAFSISSCDVRPLFAAVHPLTIYAGGTDFTLPLQKVKVTQLYSARDKKGYIGVETVLAGWGSRDEAGDQKVELTFGAAPVIGAASNVPFVGLQARLPARLFDVSNNSLMFGAWAGKESDKKRYTYGLKASVALW